MKKARNFSIMIIIGLIPLLSLLISCKRSSSQETLSGEKPLIFGSLPDPHIGDYAIESECDIQQKIADMFSYMQKRGCELILVPGDWAGGHWEDDGWVKRWGKDPEKRILPLCEKVHSCWLKHCLTYNLKPIVAPGDHEYGDNPWPENTGRAVDFPFYRKGFGLAFNIDENGNSKHNGAIGDVPLRPVGTPYENSSYAEIHNNILFVSLDLFRFEGSSVNLGWIQGATGDSNVGNQGAVSGELTDDQEVWLDAVLNAANKDENIDFIIVQSHLPVLFPVFMNASSALTVKDSENSSLWKLLKKHKVDFYIAGEVHAVTVSMEKETPPVQFVHGIRTFGIWTATDNNLKIELFDEKDVNKCLGTFSVIKKGSEKEIEANGAMVPIHINDLLVHFTLDEIEEGSKVINSGTGYSGQIEGMGIQMKQAQGILGQGVAFSSSDSSYILAGDGRPAVILTRVPRSMSAWIKTDGIGQNNTILSFASNPSMGLNMTMEEGRLALKCMGKNVLISEGPEINDNNWHHVAVTYQGENSSPAKAKLYIDGDEAKTSASDFQGDWERTHNYFVVGATRIPPSSRVITYYPSKKLETKPARLMDFFNGTIDDPAAWYGALPASYLKAMYNAATNADLKYNAASMNSLFNIYRTKGSGIVAGKTWEWTKCPSGNPGDIGIKRNKLYIVLDEQGYGVTSKL